jgi:two-component system KDP operon response regulator KdpE
MAKTEVLIIDDEMQIRKLLNIALGSNDYAVRQAATAKEGLTMAANHPPDLVVLDLGLPDENGHSVLQNSANGLPIPL